MYITDENADKMCALINKEMGKILDMPELTKDSLCLLGEMVDIMKDIKEIDGEGGMMEETNSYRGYSNRGSYNGGGYSNRYGYNGVGMGGYSSRRGMRSMDSERDRIFSKMEQFMDQASNEGERQLVRRIMDSI